MATDTKELRMLAQILDRHATISDGERSMYIKLIRSACAELDAAKWQPTAGADDADSMAVIRAQIDSVLSDTGPDVGDRLALAFFALHERTARVNLKTGYDRATARFIGPAGVPGAPANLGTLDLVALAKEVLNNIDAECDIAGDEAARALAGSFSRIMTMRERSILVMLEEEHNRLARVANGAPTLTNAVREQCSVIAYCIKLIEGGMLPAGLVSDVAPIAAAAKASP